MGRHAAPGMGGFFRELGVFALKVAVWGVIVFGGVVLIPKAIGFFTTTTTQPATSSTNPTVASATGTTATATTAPATSTVPTTTSTLATTTTTAPVRNPGDVHVQVLNSTSRNGLAAGLSETLAAAGYQMSDSDNYGQALDETYVWYAPGFVREADMLAAEYVPGAVVEASPSPLDVDVLVVIGASYQG
jgi:hypothetical protein